MVTNARKSVVMALHVSPEHFVERSSTTATRSVSERKKRVQKMTTF